MNLSLYIWYYVSGLHTLQEGDESRPRHHISGVSGICIWYYVSGTMYMVLCIWYYVSGTMYLVLCILFRDTFWLFTHFFNRVTSLVWDTVYLVRCIWYHVSGTMYLVLCIWYYISITMYLIKRIWFTHSSRGCRVSSEIPCIWYYVSGTVYLVQCIWYYVSDFNTVQEVDKSSQRLRDKDWATDLGDRT